jgi:ABC-2 type transport system permease protein
VVPLVMLAVWLTLAADGPVGSYSASDFVAYYLGVLLTRRLAGVWVVWDLDIKIREGQLSVDLLRPLHRFTTTSPVLAAKPLNLLVILPPVALARSTGASSTSARRRSGSICWRCRRAADQLFVQWCIAPGFWWSHATALQEGWFVLYLLLGGQFRWRCWARCTVTTGCRSAT